MYKHLTVISVFLLVSSFAVSLEAGALTLQDAIDRALNNNPAYQAKSYDVKAARERIPQVKTLPNPHFEVEFEKTPVSTANVSQSMYINYKLRQTIPFPTKLSKAGKAMNYDYEAEGHWRDEMELELIASVKKAFYSVVLADRLIEIEKYIWGLYNRYEAVSAEMYAAGKASFGDPLEAKAEAAEYNAKVNSLVEDRNSKLAELGYLLGEPLPSGTILSVQELSKFRYPPSIKRITSDAAISQPAVQAALSGRDAANARLSLAKQMYAPDITLELEYNQAHAAENAWTSMVGVTIPFYFFGRESPGVREANAAHVSASRRYQDSLNKYEYLIKETYERIRAAEKNTGVYSKQVIPYAEASLRSSEEAYTTEKVDFLTVIQAIKRLKEAKSGYWASRIDYEFAVADMEVLLGGMGRKGGTNEETD